MSLQEAGFSSDDERWPLMAVLTWIATRSLKLAEKSAFCDPAEAGQFLFETRRMFGAPCQISYSDSFHSLNEKIESRAIVGSGSKVKWTVAPADEQLPIEKCFPLATFVLTFSRPAPFVRKSSQMRIEAPITR
jgi:hypothetical protein